MFTKKTKNEEIRRKNGMKNNGKETRVKNGTKEMKEK
jgi:hypothetical protein